MKAIATSPSPPATEPGYRLGLGGRQKYTQYTFQKAIAVSKREAGSENALRVELQILLWDPDGKQIDPITLAASHTTQAKQAARAHVQGGGSMAEVRGVSSRLFAQQGFGDRAVWILYTVERDG